MTITDLPRELEWEILSRVPPTSLNKFRSTCRRWYALFKNPRFTEKNLGKAGRPFILKKGHGVYSVNINLHGIINDKSFDPSIEFTGKLHSLKDSEQMMISDIFQCDGLFLCTTKDKRIVVWNPCTGQTRWIPIRIQPGNGNLVYDLYALGYENKSKFSCDSFKIMSCRRDSNNYQRLLVNVYDFNSDSWRLVDEDTRSNSTVDQRNKKWRITSPGVSLKGNTYWVARDVGSRFLLRFDFKGERFERFSLPFGDYGGTFLSVVREEKLAVLNARHHYDSSREMKLWVTDNKVDEAKGVTDIQYFLVMDFREALSRGMTVASFLVDEEDKKVVCSGRDTRNGNKTVIYVVVGGDQQNVHVCEQIRGEIAQGPANDWWPFLDSYIPSSVQIQQVEAANAKGD